MFRLAKASDLPLRQRRPQLGNLAISALLFSPLVVGCYGLLSLNPWLTLGGFVLYLLLGSPAFVLTMIVFLAPGQVVAKLSLLLFAHGRLTAFIGTQLLALVCAGLLAFGVHLVG